MNVRTVKRRKWVKWKKNGNIFQRMYIYTPLCENSNALQCDLFYINYYFIVRFFKINYNKAKKVNCRIHRKIHLLLLNIFLVNADR